MLAACDDSVMGEMKEGKMAATAGFEPTLLALWAGVLNVIPPWLPCVITISRPDIDFDVART